jgi:hypothetical protein
MEITIYRRHTKQCSQKNNRYAPRCGCPLWGEFNWPQAETTLNGKKLRPGQNKWTLKARMKAEALRHAAKLENDLESLLEGKPVRQKSPSIENAIQEWLVFRAKNALSNTKPKYIGNKLVEWCRIASLTVDSTHTLVVHPVMMRYLTPSRLSTSSNSVS